MEKRVVNAERNALESGAERRVGAPGYGEFLGEPRRADDLRSECPVIMDRALDVGGGLINSRRTRPVGRQSGSS